LGSGNLYRDIFSSVLVEFVLTLPARAAGPLALALIVGRALMPVAAADT
jgi:hypothetical protein